MPSVLPLPALLQLNVMQHCPLNTTPNWLILMQSACHQMVLTLATVVRQLKQPTGITHSCEVKCKTVLMSLCPHSSPLPVHKGRQRHGCRLEVGSRVSHFRFSRGFCTIPVRFCGRSPPHFPLPRHCLSLLFPRLLCMLRSNIVHTPGLYQRCCCCTAVNGVGGYKFACG